MAEKSYMLWRIGFLQWGHEIKMITKEAEAELQRYKNAWGNELNFEELAQKVRDKQILPN